MTNIVRSMDAIVPLVILDNVPDIEHVRSFFFPLLVQLQTFFVVEQSFVLLQEVKFALFVPRFRFGSAMLTSIDFISCTLLPLSLVKWYL
jgi:hypothetical protein